MKVAILNYNIGNLSSVSNAVRNIGYESEIVTNPELLHQYDKVILPGVGAFEGAINTLHSSGMYDAILEFAKSGKYIFGICLGMQLLFHKSFEFGEHNGLGLIDGEVVKFSSKNIQIPHMGWNKIEICKDDAIFRDIDSAYLYFIHSFYAKPSNMEDVLAFSNYNERFCAVVKKDNIYGIQPHPEKSSLMGLKILQNFMEL